MGSYVTILIGRVLTTLMNILSQGIQQWYRDIEYLSQVFSMPKQVMHDCERSVTNLESK